MDRKPAFICTAIAPAMFLLLLTAPVGANTTYRWADQNGNPVLSDRPPEAGVPYTEVGVDTGFRRYPRRVAPETLAPDSAVTLDASTPTPIRSVSIAASASADAEPLPALCKQAQDNIFKLETYPRLRMRDETGEIRFIDAEERAEQLAIAYEARDANCTTGD